MKYKCVVLGNSGVGKTTLCNALKLNRGFFPSTNPTVGAAFFEIKDKKGDRISIWDTAGQEKYNSLVPLYIRDCQIIIFVCSIDNKKSIEDLDVWYNLAREYYPDNLPTILFIINKIDLDYQDLKILNPDNIYKKLENKFNNPQIFKCSGRLGKGISDIRDNMFFFMYDQQKQIRIPLLEEYIDEEEDKVEQEYEFLRCNSVTYRKPIDKSWRCC